ncbi:MAG: hypothetical protein R3F07_06875 [Opitutaceae bacterium]
MPLQFLFELNPAESVIAPFHDERISHQLPFRSVAKDGIGFRHQYGWDSTKLIWETCPAGAVAGAATLEVGDLPERFDRLIFCVVIPAEATVGFEARLDDQWCTLGDPVTGESKRIEVDRQRPAGRLTGLRIVATAQKTGPIQVGLQWWGVGSSGLVKDLEIARPRYDGRWEGLIKPAESWGKPEFARGLFFGESDLPALRHKATLPVWKGHFEKLEERARASLAREPLDHLEDYIPWSDYRYLRQREQGREPWMAEPVLCALVGLVRQDDALIRHALHHLMCFVHTTHWCQSAESRARGSTWDQRCFLEEMATTTCALLYDWLYFALTERARDLVRVALWDKGLSVIQRDMVKWEYVYTMNQGPWFCRARILAGLVLEQAWPRVLPYTEMALKDMQEGMAAYILPDGGTDEGVGYFSVTLQAVLPGLLAYARVRGTDIHDILPPALARSGSFVSIMSAMSPGGVLLDGDNSNDRFTGDTIAILAGLFPDDVYPRIAAATLLQLRGDTYYRQYMIDGPFAFIAAPDKLPEPQCVVPVFGLLSQTGQLTSRRALPDGHEVRIHLAGCKARASHTHFDKGAFTVELDDEPVLIDRGMIRYDDARGFTLKRTELHNVLAPVSSRATPIGQDSAEEAVIPEGTGDAQQLRARIDLGHVWREIMTSCCRELFSARPEELTIRDQGCLTEPLGLTFHLHSRAPWLIDAAAKRAVLRLPAWEITVEAPWAAEIIQGEDGIDHRYEPVWHLECRIPPGESNFDLVTQLRWSRV